MRGKIQKGTTESQQDQNSKIKFNKSTYSGCYKSLKWEENVDFESEKKIKLSSVRSYASTFQYNLKSAAVY